MKSFSVSQEEFIKRIKEKFSNAEFSIVEYNGSTKPITVHCNRCGLERSVEKAESILRKQNFCPRCDRKYVSIFIDLCKTNQVKILEYGKTIRENSKLLCLKCNNIWEKSISNAVNKKQVNCPYCSSKSPAHKYIDYNARIEERYGKDQYQVLVEDFIGTDKIPVRHKCGFIFKTRINDFLESQGCPKCAPRLSKGERAIIDFLDKHSINYEYQSSIKETRQRFDFLINNNIAIEYQGEQHFKDTFNDPEIFKKTIYNDQRKREYCQQNNIMLLEISYKDFHNIDRILTEFLAQRLSHNGSKEKLTTFLETEHVLN